MSISIDEKSQKQDLASIPDWKNDTQKKVKFFLAEGDNISESNY